MSLPYVCLYPSYFDSLAPFSDEECGRLLRALIQYSQTGEEPDFPGNERFIWPTLRSQADRDAEKYEKRCQQNRENSRKRKSSEPVDTEDIQSEAIDTDRCQSLSTEAKEKEKENENNKEKEKKKKKEKDSSIGDKPHRQTAFVPPSLQDVEDYVRQMQYHGLDPGAFLDYYTANGWVQGKGKKIKDWKAALRNWNRMEIQKEGKNNGKTGSVYTCTYGETL